MPLAIARGLKIPTFVVFDADLSQQNKESTKVKHERDNKMIMELCGHSGKPVWPTHTIWESNMVVWSENIATAISEDFGKTAWESLCDATKKRHGLHDLSDIFKCESYIQALMSDLWDQKKVSNNLEAVCERIIAFAKQNGIGAVVPFEPVATSASAPAKVEATTGKTEAA
jgi:hypothetical protein